MASKKTISRCKKKLEDELKKLNEQKVSSFYIPSRDERENSMDMMGSDCTEFERQVLFENQWTRNFSEVTTALQRIEQETFGYCELCHRPISKVRLLAFSKATTCDNCKGLPTHTRQIPIHV